MRHFFIMLIAIIALTACKSGDKKVAGATGTTTIQWLDSTFRDYGKVEQGRVLEISFRFKNTGDKNLIIADVRPSCGCTDPEKPEEPIAPGEEGVIKAKFDSKNQHVGENRKNITVTSNIAPPGTTELSFRVEVTSASTDSN